MTQRSFSELEFDLKKRKTRREVFLEKLESPMPWKKLEAPTVRYYTKAGLCSPHFCTIVKHKT